MRFGPIQFSSKVNELLGRIEMHKLISNQTLLLFLDKVLSMERRLELLMLPSIDFSFLNLLPLLILVQLMMAGEERHISDKLVWLMKLAASIVLKKSGTTRCLLTMIEGSKV